nr:PREDICTED: V-set and immunoglobulin domain-containing protein 10 isoform X3 [Apteryx mantelli mantelli]
MRLPGGTPPALLFLALCVWRLVPRRDAAGTEEVVYGEVGESILLLCRNVSKEATEVVWFQGDPQSVPPLFSSKVTFPQDVRFSLVDNSSLHITELRPQDEGNYTCKEVLNKTDHEHRVELLVANPPWSSPKCWAGTSSSGQMLQLFCSWPGGYPHPTLHWREDGGDLENTSWVISSTNSADIHVETLNSSRLSHRKVFKCVGSHVVKQEEPACTVEIKIPSLESEPLKTCLVGEDVTLTCRVTESTPPARLTWLQGIAQPEVEIKPGGRAGEHNWDRRCSGGTVPAGYSPHLRHHLVLPSPPVPERGLLVSSGLLESATDLDHIPLLTPSPLPLPRRPVLCWGNPVLPFPGDISDASDVGRLTAFPFQRGRGPPFHPYCRM